VKTTSKLAVLLPILFFIAMVQILPQVDLPDTVFHEDSVPVVTRSHPVSAPAIGSLEGADLSRSVSFSLFGRFDLQLTAHPVSESRHILFSTLLC
jgi:hypothetical protein